jgi:phage/plasmid-associated DNA primase
MRPWYLKALVKWLEEGGHLGCQQINSKKIQSEEDPVEQWTIRPIRETV